MSEPSTREQQLSEVTHTISSALDIETILQSVVELSAELVGADAGALGLLTPDGTALEFRHLFNLPEDWQGLRLARGEGVAWQTIATREAHLYSDYSNHPAALPIVVAQNPSEVISVPLAAGDECLGVLAIYNLQADPRFTEADLVLFEAIGRQAGVAIQNARRYAAERQRAEELEALRATLADISAQLDLTELLQAILDRATSLLQGSKGEIGLFDEQRQALELVVAHGSLHRHHGDWLPLGHGVLGYVAQTRQALIIGNLHDWDYVAPLHLSDQACAVLGVPLLAGAQLVGSLIVCREDLEQPFEPSDVRLLELFAQQATIAIRNARLYEAAKQRADEAETLRQAAAVVVSSLNEDEAIERILEQLAHVVPYDSASVQLLRGNEMELVGGRGFSEHAQLIGLRLPLDDSNPGKRVYDLRRTVILDNVHELYPVYHNPPHEHVRSWLGVPLMFQDRLIGLVAIDGRERNQFTEQDARLVAAFADQVAVALEHARLFAEVQQMAITDSLTGLYNRRHFFDLAQRAVAYARRYGRDLTTLMIDIDHFKRINDTYGHATGDQVLAIVAGWCQRHFRTSDIVGRYGGEEFAVLLPDTALKEAYQIATRVRKAIARQPVLATHPQLVITISVGVAMRQPNDQNPDHMLLHADRALYAAKQAGRNRVEVWVEGE